MTYSVVLGILVVCQIGAGIAGFVMKDDLINSLETELKKTMPVRLNKTFYLLKT